MPIGLAPDSLVVLVGASGSGKSHWAQRHFGATQVVSSDRCRALVSDHEENQGVSREAFAVFYTLIAQRLSLGRLTVADSTGLQPFSRLRMLAMARERVRPAHAVVFDAPLEVLLRQNAERSRRVPEPVVERHAAILREMKETGALEAEGFDAVHRIGYPPDAGAAAVLILPDRMERPPPGVGRTPTA